MSIVQDSAETHAVVQSPTNEGSRFLIDNGGHAQRLNVVRQLPVLFQLDQQGCLERIIPQLNQQLRRDDVDLHTEVANAYLQLVQQRQISPQDYASSFLPSILFYLNRGDRGVFSVWCYHLTEVIGLLSADTVHRKIFPVTVGMSQISAPVYHRAAAARLLGRMCSTFDQHKIMKDVLPLIHSLCQDVSSEVRANACQQFHQLAKGLPEEVIKTSLIPSLIELARDEEELVQAEAIETIVLMLPVLSLEVKRSTIVPLIYSICQRVERCVDESTVRLAKHFADLVIGLDPVLSPVSRLTMIRYYCDLSSLGAHTGKRLKFGPNTDPEMAKGRIIECRRLCAENFSRLIKLSITEQMWQKLFRAFVEFSADPSCAVRKTVAANLLEVSNAVGDKMKVVRRVLIALLKDPAEEVLSGLAPNLGAVVDTICLSGIYHSDQDPARYELASAMICAITTVENSTNWRLVEELYKQMESAVRFLPSNYIYTHLLPIFFQRMHQAKAKPVQLAAGRTTLHYLRYNLKKVQREKIRSHLESEFCRNHSCHERILYLRLCEVARQMFSASYFKSNFLMPLLSLADDPVPNCRFIVAKQLGPIRLMVVGDGRYEGEVHRVISFMDEKEKDVDVREMIERLKLKVKPGDELDLRADKLKYEEERKLAAVLNSNSIADPPDHTSKPVPRKNSKRLDDKASVSRVTKGYFKPESSVDYTLPSSPAFERDFYRDTGVHVVEIMGIAATRRLSSASLQDQKSNQRPQYLSTNGRSKSFILPTTKISVEEEVPVKPLTRIPVSGSRSSSHRRSLDVTHLARPCDVRSRGVTNSAIIGISRLPVRKGRRDV